MRRLLLTVVVLSACVSPHRGPATDNSGTAPAEASIAKIEAIFKPHVKVLDRALIGFHYSEQEDPSKTPKSLDDVKKYALIAAGSFHLPGATGKDMVGPGFYVAVDPAATRVDYGGESPNLTVVSIHAGTVVLDGTYELTLDEIATYNDIASKMQCYGEGGFGDATIGKAISVFRNNGKSMNACIQLISTVIKNLKIQTIIYPYRAEPLAGCRFRYQSLNVIDPAILDVTGFYSDHAKFGSLPEGRIRTLYDESTAAFPNQLSADKPKLARIPTRLTAPYDDSEAYIQWRDQNVFSCGVHWSLESKSANTVQPVSRDYSPRQKLLLSIKSAYKAKSGDDWFRVMEIKAVRRLAASAAQMGSSQELEKWQTALGALQGYAFDYHDGKGEDQLDMVEQMFGEKLPPGFAENRMEEGPIFGSRCRRRLDHD